MECASVHVRNKVKKHTGLKNMQSEVQRNLIKSGSYDHFCTKILLHIFTGCFLTAVINKHMNPRMKIFT